MSINRQYNELCAELRSYNNDQWGNMWVSGASGGQMAGNTPTTNIYNSGTNRDGRWNYDSAGILLTINGNTASYDAENQLKTLSTTAGAAESLLYDGLGRRVQKSFGGTTTTYVYECAGRPAWDRG